jgi:hypothetical protein
VGVIQAHPVAHDLRKSVLKSGLRLRANLSDQGGMTSIVIPLHLLFERNLRANVSGLSRAKPAIAFAPARPHV